MAGQRNKTRENQNDDTRRDERAPRKPAVISSHFPANTARLIPIFAVLGWEIIGL
jgi:hypothetical protein